MLCTSICPPLVRLMLFDQFTKMYAIVFIALCASLPSILVERPRLLTDLFPQDRLCGLSTQDRLAALAHIKEAADLLSAGAESAPVKVEDCGEGLWGQVADLDITRGDTTCPGAVRQAPLARCLIRCMPPPPPPPPPTWHPSPLTSIWLQHLFVACC